MQRETKWTRLLSNGNFSWQTSKLDSGEASIDLSDLRSVWPTWSDEERFDFASALSAKGQFSAEEQAVLRFVAENGDWLLLDTIAFALALLPEKDRTFQLLTRAIRDAGEARVPNLYNALGVLTHPSAGEFLETETKHLLANIDIGANAVNCIGALSSLYRLGRDGALELLHALKQHPDSDIASLSAAQIAILMQSDRDGKFSGN